MNFQSNQIALIKFFYSFYRKIIPDKYRMIELEKHNFVVPNEITDSNNNYQLMKPMDKRLNLTTKGSGISNT